MAFRISIAPNFSSTLRFPTNSYSWETALVTLQSNAGGSFVGAPSETVIVSFTPSAGATVLAFDGSTGPVSGITNASGQWLANFVSTTPGVISFSASHPASGVSTNGVLPNSGPATGNFANSRISLSPLITTVTAGTNATITALVEFNNFGAAWNDRTSATTITWTLTNLNGAVASPAGPLTGTSITFTSSSVGQVRVRASASPTNSPNLVGAIPVRTGNDQVVGLLQQLIIANVPDTIVNFT